jgi:hypothetical protein
MNQNILELDQLGCIVIDLSCHHEIWNLMYHNISINLDELTIDNTLDWLNYLSLYRKREYFTDCVFSIKGRNSWVRVESNQIIKPKESFILMASLDDKHNGLALSQYVACTTSLSQVTNSPFTQLQKNFLLLLRKESKISFVSFTKFVTWPT